MKSFCSRTYDCADRLKFRTAVAKNDGEPKEGFEHVLGKRKLKMGLIENQNVEEAYRIGDVAASVVQVNGKTVHWWMVFGGGTDFSCFSLSVPVGPYFHKK